MAVHYLEIVSSDAEALTELYQRMHGLSFGPPDPRSWAGPGCDPSRRSPGRHPEAAGGT